MIIRSATLPEPTIRSSRASHGRVDHTDTSMALILGAPEMRLILVKLFVTFKEASDHKDNVRATSDHGFKITIPVIAANSLQDSLALLNFSFFQNFWDSSGPLTSPGRRITLAAWEKFLPPQLLAGS